METLKSDKSENGEFDDLSLLFSWGFMDVILLSGRHPWYGNGLAGDKPGTDAACRAGNNHGFAFEIICFLGFVVFMCR